MAEEPTNTRAVEVRPIPTAKSRVRSKTYWGLALIALGLLQKHLPVDFIQDIIKDLSDGQGLIATGLGLAIFGQETRSLPFKRILDSFRREEGP